MRKHTNQMSQAERQAIRSAVLSLPVQSVIQHAKDRMAQKHVTPEQAMLAIQSGQVIELHNDAGTLRTLLRVDLQSTSVCVVLDLDRRAIITVWRNAVNDTHRTLDLSAYQW